MFFKQLISRFNPIGFFTGLSIKTWITIISVGIIIGFGFYLKYLWEDYKSLQKENAVQQEQNNQLTQDNKNIKDDSDKKDQSSDIDNQTSEDTNNKKKENDKEFSDIIKAKNKDLKNIPLSKKKDLDTSISNNVNIESDVNQQPVVDVNEIIKQRSNIRINKIQEAYCATQKTCKE